MKGWAIGEGKSVLGTENGGNSWQEIAIVDNNIYYDVYFADTSLGWIVGKSGVILRSSDGGATWEQQESGTMADLKSIKLLSTGAGMIVGDNGLLLHTSNSGENWDQKYSGTHQDFNDVYVYADTLSWKVGSNGTILGGKGSLPPTPDPDQINQTKENLLVTCKPNPFKDLTSLSIFVEEPGELTIRMTDLNGKLVYSFRTVVYSSGKVSFPLKTGSLPNGVYLSLIQTNGRSKCIKMVKH
jgi:hypothetical protein